jgi:hypothetical protein
MSWEEAFGPFPFIIAYEYFTLTIRAQKPGMARLPSQRRIIPDVYLYKVYATKH